MRNVCPCLCSRERVLACISPDRHSGCRRPCRSILLVSGFGVSPEREGGCEQESLDGPTPHLTTVPRESMDTDYDLTRLATASAPTSDQSTYHRMRERERSGRVFGYTNRDSYVTPEFASGSQSRESELRQVVRAVACRRSQQPSCLRWTRRRTRTATTRHRSHEAPSGPWVAGTRVIALSLRL